MKLFDNTFITRLGRRFVNKCIMTLLSETSVPKGTALPYTA